MHPVIGGELGAVGSQRIRASGIRAIVGPSNGLHIRAQIAVVAVEVHAQELAVGAGMELIGLLSISLGSAYNARSHIRRTL